MIHSFILSFFHSFTVWFIGWLTDPSQAVRARATGMIILGGGLVKHHTCNANLMRNGANFSVFVNTGQAFDGSDSGAPPDEVRSRPLTKQQINRGLCHSLSTHPSGLPLSLSLSLSHTRPLTPSVSRGRGGRLKQGPTFAPLR